MSIRLRVVATVLLFALSGCSSKLINRFADYVGDALLDCAVEILINAAEENEPKPPTVGRPSGIHSVPVPFKVPIASMHDAVMVEVDALGGTLLEDEVEDESFLVSVCIWNGKILVTHHIYGQAVDADSSTIQYVTKTEAQGDPLFTCASRALIQLQDALSQRLTALEWQFAPTQR
jgi:hypothetical protein